MRQHKKTFAYALVASVFFTLAACGSSSDDNEKGSEAEKVSIQRDSYGVPHIYADTPRALFYGYGYAVAEDRLFQMEMARRSVLGTTAEVLGASYVANDQKARETLNAESIRKQIAALPKNDLDVFEGYAAGYNARLAEVLANKGSLMPKQFIDAGFEPQPWTSFDVAMIWVGTMANRYSSGSSELANLQLLTRLVEAKGEAVGRQLFDQLRWLEDSQAPTTVPRPAPNKSVAISDTPSAMSRLALLSESVEQPADAHTAAVRGFAAPDERPTASYAWLVGGSKSTDGSTIFNNGPQFGWFNPSYVYAVGLHGAGYDVVGNSPFGHPAVLFGTNGSISWGSTAGPLDVNDVYQLDLNPDNPRSYRFEGKYRDMDRRVETIRVKGADNVTMEIFSSVHGRVTTFDEKQNKAYAIRSSWHGLEIQSFVAWLHSTKATNWDEFLASAEKVAITNNWYYADAKGNIGYVSPGRQPIRPDTQDIRLPALGDGTMEWKGFKNFSETPKAYNPEQGYIANWNNQSAPGVHGDGSNYSAVDRVNEFIFRLEAKEKLTPEEIISLNKLTAISDMNARYFVPYIVKAVEGMDPASPVYQAAMQLKGWNGLNEPSADQKNYTSPAVTILRTWLPIMYRRLLADHLPEAVLAGYSSAGYPDTPPSGSPRPGNGSKLLYNALRGDQAGVPQQYDFFNGADKNAMVVSALEEAVQTLTQKFGADQKNWLTPVVQQRFSPVNFLGIPQASSDEALFLPVFLNNGSQDNHITFSKGNVTVCTVAAPGQSGFISPSGEKSPHYQDQMELFATLGCKNEKLTKSDVDADTASTKVLSLN